MLLESQVSSLLSLFFPRPLLPPLTFQRQGVFQPSILTVERNWSSSSPTSPPRQRHSPGGLGCGPCGRLFGIRRGFLPTLLALERAQQGSLCDRAVLISQLASLEAFVDGGWRRCIWGSSFTPPPALFFFFWPWVCAVGLLPEKCESSAYIPSIHKASFGHAGSHWSYLPQPPKGYYSCVVCSNVGLCCLELSYEYVQTFSVKAYSVISLKGVHHYKRAS